MRMKKLFQVFILILSVAFIGGCGVSNESSTNSSYYEQQQQSNESPTDNSYKLSDGTQISVQTQDGTVEENITVVEIDPEKQLGKDEGIEFVTKGFELNAVNRSENQLDNSTLSIITITLPKELADSYIKKVGVYVLQDNELVPIRYKLLRNNQLQFIVDKNSLNSTKFFIIYNSYLVTPDEIPSPQSSRVTLHNNIYQGPMYPEIPVDIENGFFTVKVFNKNKDKIYIKYSCPGNNNGEVRTGNFEGDWELFQIPLKTNEFGFCKVSAFKDVRLYADPILYTLKVPIDKKFDVYKYENLLKEYAPVVEFGYLDPDLLPSSVFNWLKNDWYGCYEKEIYKPIALEKTEIFVNGTTDKLKPVCYSEVNPSGKEAMLYANYGFDYYHTLLKFLYRFPGYTHNTEQGWSSPLYGLATYEYSIVGLGEENILGDRRVYNFAKYIIPDSTYIYATAYEDEEHKVIYLQYWFYYIYDPKTPNNYWAEEHWWGSVSPHFGDAERITIVVDANTQKPLYVFFAHHNNNQRFGYLDIFKLESMSTSLLGFLQWYIPETENISVNSEDLTSQALSLSQILSFTWNEEGFGEEEGIGGAIVSWNKVEKVDTHPLIYVALGSHGIYPRKGIYAVDEPMTTIPQNIQTLNYRPFQPDLVEFAGGDKNNRVNYEDKIVIVPRLGEIDDNHPLSFLYFGGGTDQAGEVVGSVIQSVSFFSQTEPFIFPEKKDGCLVVNNDEYCKNVNITDKLFPNNDIITCTSITVENGTVTIDCSLIPKVTSDLYFMPENGYKLYVKWDKNDENWEEVAEYSKETLETTCPTFRITHIYSESGNYKVLLRFETPTGAFVEKELNVEIELPQQEVERGNIQGAVKDAITYEPIQGVKVSLIKGNDNNDTVAETVTDANGNYNLANVPVGNYTIIFTKEGYLPASGNVVVEANSTTTYPTLMQIDTEHSGNGTIKGVVKDAINGQPVPGVIIKVFEGINNIFGEPVATISTSEDGSYQLELKAGYYTFLLSKDDYKETNYSLSVVGNTITTKEFTISPVLPTNEVRIVLTWGETPKDLDAHLVKVKGEDIEYHLYWYYADSCPDHGNCHGSPTQEANLDVDDITSFGPETITIHNLDPDATYKYYVHDYSTYSGDTSTALANSGATVKVYWGDRTYTYYVPNLPGTAWKVFEIVNGTLVPCTSDDCVFGVSSETDSQFGTRAINSVNPDVELFKNLPAK